jgi:hypothetical protein
MDASEWLEAAADYIEEHGWVRVELEHAGRVCLVGSLFKTLPGRPEHDVAIIEAEEPLRFVASELGIGTDGVPRSRWWTEVVRWNEEVAKNTVEVVDTLRWAAKRARDADAGGIE